MDSILAKIGVAVLIAFSALIAFGGTCTATFFWMDALERVVGTISLTTAATSTNGVVS